MSDYRLVIEEIKDAKVITSYTRWVDAVQVRGTENQEVYLTFSPRFERIWLESKKRFPDCMEQKPANTGLRSRYALRLYSWAKKYVTVGTRRIWGRLTKGEIKYASAPGDQQRVKGESPQQ